MSYASYEQEQQDQEVFQKLVAAHKAKEHRDEVKQAQAHLIEAMYGPSVNSKWIVNATPIQYKVSEYERVNFTDIAPLGDSEYAKK